MKTTQAPRGCEEYHRSLTSRRSFLKGLGVVSAGGVMATMHGTVFTQTAFAASGQATNVLVVLSQRGGADGMSLVVPYGDPAYYLARQTIGIPQSQLLQKDGFFGLHPKLAPLEQMWMTGQMAAVHAVGLASPNRSHFSAILDVEEADPGSTARVGWLNRMVGMTAPGSLHDGVQIGQSVPQTEIYGPQATLSAVDIEKVQIYGPPNAMGRRIQSLNNTWDHASGPIGQAGRDAMETAAEWDPVLQTSKQPQNGASYPAGSDLGEALAQSARLIRADVGAEVITVDHSSWDMHTGLGTLDVGDMRLMADELAQSIAAFFTDLGTLGANVTLITISEFGRRVIENGDAGLDHGWGNAMLVLGAGVKGGSVYAKWPGLDASETVDGDLKVTTDYRSVLYEVVNARFPGVSLPSLFPGFAPERVGVMLGA
ncbi:MAG: DUF1501 domain-containing protein [Actinomycetota bacterium]|nr:DUF1501 domain-containing protein [Actinomycetota bacterium]